MPEKVCSACKESKDVSDFSPQASGLYGVRGMCKPCSADYNRRWRAAKAGSALTTECECGRAKADIDESCSDCATLDSNGSVGALVSALRVLGGSATMAALIDEMGLAETNVYRAIRMATAEGRLFRRVQHEQAPNFRDEQGRELARRGTAQRGESRQGTQMHAPPIYVLVDRRTA